jgi:hypothetical protein
LVKRTWQNTTRKKTRKKVLKMRDIEHKIREVDSTMAMEGMPLTEDDKEVMRTVLRGEISFNDMKARIINEYKPRRAVNERE